MRVALPPRADDRARRVGYGRGVRSDAWSARAVVVAAVVGAAGVIAADGGRARVEVAVLSTVLVLGLLVRNRWAGMPPALLAVWTFPPPTVLNLRHRGEGTMF